MDIASRDNPAPLGPDYRLTRLPPRTPTGKPVPFTLGRELGSLRLKKQKGCKYHEALESICI